MKPSKYNTITAINQVLLVIFVVYKSLLLSLYIDNTQFVLVCIGSEEMICYLNCMVFVTGNLWEMIRLTIVGISKFYSPVILTLRTFQNYLLFLYTIEYHSKLEKNVQISFFFSPFLSANYTYDNSISR